MPKTTTRPNPPHDYAERAKIPLDRGDADMVSEAVERILGTRPDLTVRQRRATEMLCFPVKNVPSWVRHHAGEVWSSFSQFAAQGGIEFCRESDDLDEVCDLFERMPDCWLDRLEACFVGLEREGDADGFFRQWYAAITRRYLRSLAQAQSSSPSDSGKRHFLCTRVVAEEIPSFAQFFDSLREFVGAGHASSGRWRQGDEYRKGWEVDCFIPVGNVPSGAKPSS